VHITVTTAKVPIPNGDGAQATIDQPTTVGVLSSVTTTLRAAASDDLTAFGKQLADMKCGDACGNCGGACAPIFQAKWISGRADEHVVSGRWVFTTYFPGAAHPFDAYQSLIVDAQTGRVIDVTALFAHSSLNALAATARPLLSQALNATTYCAPSGSVAQDTFDSGVAPTADNYQAVAVVASGLAVAMPEGQLAAMACGGFHVTVPWSSVRSALSPLGLAIADGTALPAS
jgi:hypothetical protein